MAAGNFISLKLLMRLWDGVAFHQDVVLLQYYLVLPRSHAQDLARWRPTSFFGVVLCDALGHPLHGHQVLARSPVTLSRISSSFFNCFSLQTPCGLQPSL